MNTEMMVEMRCTSCGKLLAKTDGNTEIVCPRCGAKNSYDATTGKIKCEVRKQRQRSTSSGTVFR